MYQNDEDSYPVQQPMMMGHTSEGSLHYQIDTNEILMDIERTLKAEMQVIDYKTGSVDFVIPEGVEPLINQKGINAILTILKSRLTKIFILSDLEEDTIRRITWSIGGNVIDDLYYNWDEYGIKDDAAASKILSLITDTTYATLRKGYMGNYLKFLRTTHTIQEMQHRSVQEQPKQQDGSDNPLSFLFKKKR